MKRIITLLGFSAVLASPLAGYSQDKHCGTAERLRDLYSKNPQLAADHEEFLQNCMSQMNSGSRADDTVYPIITIPLVFHVIHEYGNENITDAQIVNQVNILNDDYRKMNADTVEVVPAFDTLIADARIEFKLANLDPDGNCTNGIVHYYSHESRNGDDFSKLVQWPRGKYLNIWVVKQMRDGVAGYAYYPSAVPSLPMAIADGIIILNDYIGSIGTSNPNNSRALTHEIGHYLSLPHTWGSTNEPTVACGDDGIADTPVTKGHDGCSAADLNDMTCTPGVIENTQNYMEYSYCSVMFTPGQVYSMRMTLASSVSNRNNLWTAANLTATGVDGTPVLCSPVPDMSPNEKYVCMGDNVTFKSFSYRAPVTSYSWSFPGATPSTSTAAAPTVTYNTFGWHDVTLTVTNAAGSETKTFSRAVYVTNGWPDYIGPHSEGFESSSTSAWWVVDNPEDNEARWQRVNYGTPSGSNCFMLNNHKDTDMFSYLYFNQLGGNQDALISPTYDLSHTSAASLTFKYSCATHAYTLVEQTEQLQVYSSNNCGKTWALRGPAIKGAELTNAGTVASGYMGSSSLWTTKTISLPASILTNNVRFKFEYTASDYSNNIFIDDINIIGVLGVDEELTAQTFDLNVYPNPSTAEKGMTVAFVGSEKEMLLTVTDVVGQVVYNTNIAANSGEVNHYISTQNLGKGIYMVNLTNGVTKQTVKVVIQ